MQRTFIALKIHPEKEMMDCIHHLKDALRKERITWVDPGKLHITLHFLGDSSPSLVASTIRILEETVPGFRAPEIEFKGLGVFRNTRDPRVIWIGMDPGTILPALRTRIGKELIPHGFTPETRKFSPHLTLGRIKSSRERTQSYREKSKSSREGTQKSRQYQNSLRDYHPGNITGILEELLSEYRDMRFQKNRIEQLDFIESFLRPEGPEYLTLRSFFFK